MNRMLFAVILCFGPAADALRVLIRLNIHYLTVIEEGKEQQHRTRQP